jgi:hypothetical protein
MRGPTEGSALSLLRLLAPAATQARVLKHTPQGEGGGRWRRGAMGLLTATRLLLIPPSTLPCDNEGGGEGEGDVSMHAAGGKQTCTNLYFLTVLVVLTLVSKAHVGELYSTSTLVLSLSCFLQLGWMHPWASASTQPECSLHVC